MDKRAQPAAQPKPAGNATDSPDDQLAQPHIFHTLTIGGQVPLENWTQLFISFINTLKDNQQKIEIKIKMTAHSTTTKIANSLYASVKE